MKKPHQRKSKRKIRQQTNIKTKENEKEKLIEQKIKR